MNPLITVLALLLLAQASPAAGTSPEGFWNFRASDVLVLLATVITSSVMIWAVIQAPKWAVKIQWELQLRKEERDRRLSTFKTLMATRAMTVDFRHVQALNMIDVEFSSNSAEDVAVRSAWQRYLDALNDVANFKTAAQLEKRRDLLAELLQRMGEALDYRFDFTYLKSRAYYPQGHEDDAMESIRLRKGLLEIVEGKKPLKMEVCQSEDTARTGAALSNAWMEIAEGKKALKMEVTVPPPVVPISKPGK